LIVRRFLQIVALALLMMVVVGTGNAAASGFSFPFTSKNEGWETNNGEALHSAAWAGGAISVTDTPSGGYSAFLTPLGFGGDYSANYGGTLSFEIKSSKTWSEEDAFNLLGTGNEEEPLCAYVGVTPGTGYQTADVTLTPGNFFGGVECSEEATEAEVAEVLATLQLVVIGGDDEPASGETTTIDNVDLAGGSPPPKHRLTLLKAGGGSGSVSSSPAGIDCGATCSAEFVTGAKVTLTATPATGSTFTGWSGGGCSGMAPCNVSLSADREVTALFAVASSSGGGGSAPPATPTPISKKQKPLTCKKGFKKKKVHGTFKCLKIKHHKKNHHAH
jgi:hypothetical protein